MADQKMASTPGSRRLALPLAVTLIFTMAACSSDTDSGSGATPTATSAVVTTATPPSAVSPTTVLPTTVPSTTVPPTTGPPPTVPSTTVLDPLDGLTVRIDDEIRFAGGETSTALSGAVLGSERDAYRIGAAANQELTISLTSLEDNAVFDLFDPLGNPLAAEASEVTVDLPLDGEYLVVIGSSRGNASYELFVSIPA